ncbi:MAG: bifunctional UDP-N-acetylglucosamine diphosphorylase/glucosamine-1-phosphate N-acetyltransferase GlmU [Firmicutes bacterium]|nr:bifunctional UDP-N-acetylglucosamine diphosphorylase/glucosamine-1-phosphate N-acetyltransferase GlmU [Bacillota bacterium]
MKTLAAVILAAGKGTRMKSKLPKVLHKVGGRTMLEQIIATLEAVGVEQTFVVVGYGADMVRSAVQKDVHWVSQHEQLGTGHAVLQAASALSGFEGNVLVVNGDAPLLTAQSLEGLVNHHLAGQNAATVLTADVEDPTGYGRIIRNPDGRVQGIVEHKDADPSQRKITEVNSGSFCFHWPRVSPVLKRLTPANAQDEYYLTDVLSLLNQDNLPVGGYQLSDPMEMSGVNDRVQLAVVAEELKNRTNQRLMLAGVTIVDPGSTWIDVDVKIAPDTIILPNTFIKGGTEIGEDCIIGPETTLENVRIGDNVTVRNSIISDSAIGDNTTVGPFAYIRPNCQIGRDNRIGDFVELKNAHTGDGSKVPHLAYVGDARIGAHANIGCGVITANYDGQKKHITTIGDKAFIGSNSNLIAPVNVEDNAYVAAGSTITDDVPARALAVARCRQTVKPDWRKD